MPLESHIARCPFCDDPACDGIAAMLTLATIESGVERRLRHVSVHLELVSARSTAPATSNNTTREPNFGASVWHLGLGQESWRTEVEFLTTQLPSPTSVLRYFGMAPRLANRSWRTEVGLSS